LIYVVVRANIPSIFLHVKYISMARNPAKLTAEPGYYFTNLQSALSWVDMMDHTHLSISKEDFQRLWELGRQRIQAAEQLQTSASASTSDALNLPPVPSHISPPTALRTDSAVSEGIASPREEADVSHDIRRLSSPSAVLQLLQTRFHFLNAEPHEITRTKVPLLLKEYKQLAAALVRLHTAASTGGNRHSPQSSPTKAHV